VNYFNSARRSLVGGKRIVASPIAGLGRTDNHGNATGQSVLKIAYLANGLPFWCVNNYGCCIL
jgi:hypothetical protein